MAGKVLSLSDLLDEDDVACNIGNIFREWELYGNKRRGDWRELRQYLYATDTKHTSNSKLEWSNSTTIPKLTQIRDNLYSNYLATLFPKRKWMNWLGDKEADEAEQKVTAVKVYMVWATSQPSFKSAISKLVLDYIDYGNCFSTVEWVDESTEDPKKNEGIKLGFVGPKVVRISPEDIVMNPLSPEFSKTPKIWRSLMSLGEAFEFLDRVTATEEDTIVAQKVKEYCLQIRADSGSYGGKFVNNVHERYMLNGFESFQSYLQSDTIELLTFAGDYFCRDSKSLMKNRLVVVIDRHKVALNIPYPFPTADIPIYHAGWRIRQDSLWAMGPLDNLVGLQYRLDHLENMKSDIMDLVTYPVIKIKGDGTVGDFEWGPLAKIYIPEGSDVEMMSPDVNALQVNVEINQIESKMEELAGSPKEAMGFRTPGEKTAYEVQRLENAASRIFQNKIAQFEEQVIEPLLNAMLALARQNLSEQTIRVVDDEFGVVSFENITKADLSANGRLKPVAARHFAEQAELIQNLTSFYSSGLASPEVKLHFSGLKIASIVEDALNLSDYKVVLPYVAISEQAEAEKLTQASAESVQAEGMAPTGLTPEDFSDPSMLGGLEGAAPEDV